MELLEQLEQRVADLLARMDALKAENAELAARSNDWEAFAEEADTLRAENSALRQELELEKQTKQTALNRVEQILLRIKEQTTQE